MSGVPWVCGACRSINQPRETRCYRCRTPRDLGEVNPETLITAGAGSKPAAVTKSVADYRSSRARAVLAQVLIVAAMAVTVLSSFLGADLLGRMLDGVAFDEESVVTVGVLGLVGLGLGAAALVSFAAWLSRVVANVPTLGLGWTNVTPTAAIYESIIPVVNLYRVPAILRDVTNRLEPNGRGDALIAAAWLGLVGGVILPRFLRLATTYLIGDIDELTRVWVVVNQLGLGLTLVGGAFLVVLIQWIETRMGARARSAPAAAQAAEPAEPTPPSRAQPIAESVGGALAARPEQRAAPDHPEAHPEPRLQPADHPVTRPRWGGAVAAPTTLSAGPPAAHHPADRAGAERWDDELEDSPLADDQG